MKRTLFLNRPWAILLSSILGAATLAQEVKLQSYKSPEGDAAQRLDALAQALGFETWPTPTELFVGPAISRSLLREPGLTNRETRACTFVEFDEQPWGRCDWSWKRVVSPGEAASAGGPRARGGRILDGELDLTVVLAPSARAAQEYLLVGMTDNMLGTGALVAMYQAAERPAGLGTVALLTRSRDGGDVRLRFARANVALAIRGTGRLRGEVLRLAQTIDDRILDQQPLTPEQLLGRRPTVRISSAIEGEVPFEVTVPQDRKVLAVHASVNGQTTPTVSGRILLGLRKGRTQTEVVVITQDLLAGVARREVTAEP